jgi:sterol desaturase/sphingolipid hydroxylase (fatty acid hydroxylase superfamily)
MDIVEYLGRYAPLYVAGVFAGLFVLERLSPLRKRKLPAAGRLLVNTSMTLMVFVVGTFIVGGVGKSLAAWSASAPFGLLHSAPGPAWLKFMLGFLLMDLTFYWWHRANHEIPLLWRFHNVHHLDPDLDVTTSYRFHPVEILYSTVFRVVQIALIGVSPLTYAVYEVVFSVGTAFHHSNMRLPIGLERALNKLFVTPRMHGVHHSDIRDEANTNYSVVLNIWDRLHRTLTVNVPQADVNTGVAGYAAPEDNRLIELIKFPFAVQRDYWTAPDGGSKVARSPVPSSPKTTMME